MTSSVNMTLHCNAPRLEPGLGQVLARAASEAVLQVAVLAVGGAVNFERGLRVPAMAGDEWRRIATGGAAGVAAWAATRAIADASPFLHQVVDASSALGVAACATLYALQYGLGRYGQPVHELTRHVWAMGGLGAGAMVGGIWWRLHALGEA